MSGEDLERALITWREKLAEFELQFSITSNHNQKFELRKDIDKCRKEIQRLEAQLLSNKERSEITQQKIEPTPIHKLSNLPLKILVLLANPKKTSRLRLDEEIREIKQALRRSRERDRFSLESAEAVRFKDVRQQLLDHAPQIVHFSGHGTEHEGLMLEDNTGQAKLVDADTLARLFKSFSDDIECVILNACYSEKQADAIAEHINYVIGMDQAIDDRAAIEFSTAFYEALGAGRTVEFAYEIGCTSIQGADLPGCLVPKIHKKK